MDTVVAVYTGQGLAEPLKKQFDELLPGVRLVNIMDDSLIAEVVREGAVTPGVKRRLMQYYQNGVDLGASIILNTCSSVGEVASDARPFLSIPLVKIDESMAVEAVESYSSIGVLATLPTTLRPTMRLLLQQAELRGKPVRLIEGLAAGAYDALVSGRPDEHDRILMETAIRVAEQAEVLVLAQGSMARMEAQIAERTRKPVLSSPRRSVMEIKRLLEAKGEGS
ncbi:aspartate/glutamate racemase family protein [Paenibacillus donghaensis]|uniref:Asp/Glu/hydantoin racemase n=1 Tax=Paenibacillus donghaensis TaxID=414771 RepID=A0A2Z2KYS4_9BACL|nr:aspartate/glutamate racemase family protein [Paenibacillus donghaensis]ASA25788.1 Asp/Glu/hydantoin racemase [Paenibacillus donghaensis]